MTVPTQINNIPIGSSAMAFSQLGQGQPASGFMGILSSMMGGNIQNSNAISTLGQKDMSLETLLQDLASKDGNSALLDPLLLSLIQQLVTNPQQLQDFLSQDLQLSDSGIKKALQLNQVQIENLIDFVKTFVKEDGKNYKNMTPDEIRQAILEKLSQTLSADNKSGVDTQSTNPVDKNVHAVVDAVAINISEKQATNVSSLSTNYEINTPKYRDATDRVASSKLTEGENLSNLHTNSEGSDLSKSSSSLEEALFVSELELEEPSISSLNTLKTDETIGINKSESTVINANSHNQQVTVPKAEHTVKESLPVSRLQEIDTSIIKTIQNGNRSLTVKLEPPELGTINIKLVLTDGMVRADIRVDNLQVKDMMNLAVPQIRQSLENAGIRVSEFAVDIREEYYSDGKRQNNDNEGGKNQHQKRNRQEDSKPFEYYV